MATTSITDVFDVGEIISGSSVRQLQEEFSILPGRDATIVQEVGYGESVRLSDSMKYEWIVDEYIADTVTVNNGAGYADSATSVVVDDATPVQVGSLIKIGDETARVTAVNHSTETLTIVRSWGASAAEAMVDNQVLYVLPSSHVDTATFTQSNSLRGEFLFNYPQQIMHSFKETGMSSGRTNYLTGGATELAYAEMKHMVEVERKLARAVYYNEKVAPTAANAGGFDGLDALITNNVNSSVGLLTATKLVNLLELIWEDRGNMQGITVKLNHDTKRVFDAVLNAGFSRVGEPTTNELGLVVDRFQWNGGTIDFSLDHWVQDGHAFFVDTSEVSIHPIEVRLPGVGSGWNKATRQVEHTNAVQVEDVYWGIFTLVLREQRNHGKMKGITTSLGSYPGAA